MLLERGKIHQEPVMVNRAIIDLELIIQSFTSNALIIRLNYVADSCPPLRGDAFRGLIDYLRNVTLRSLT